MVLSDQKDVPGAPASDTGDKPKRSEGSASFLRAARAGNLDKLLELLKGDFDINTSNANGLNALHLSSKDGHVKVVQELLSRGANVNAATKKGNTALHIASLAGQVDVVRELVQAGAAVNVQSQNGFTPLYMAAQENHVLVVQYLLEEGGQQGLATEDGFTPLAVALQQGHDKVVALLLEADSKGRVRLPALHIAAKKDDTKAATLLLANQSADLTTKSGFTPLHIAAHYGNTSVGLVLLQKNADPDFKAKNGITPLHVSAKWGKLKMISLLLEQGATLDEATKDGLSALHCASRSGHDRAVDLLLEKGANHSAKTRSGLSPLHMAAQGDHVDCARLLLYWNAPVDDVTVDYLTALHVAAHCGNVRIAKLLLDRKCEPNARALNGFTPLHIACKKNRLKVIELLLKHGGAIEATTESGLTPLHVAAFMGHMSIAVYLLQHGANPDTQTVRGETSLHLAARANQTDIMRVLLRNGADVNAKAREQQTSLHICARLGSVENVQLLMQHKAHVNAETRDGYTPLHIAAKEGQEETAGELVDGGGDMSSKTAKGFTPLHIAAKYGKIKVVRLLLERGAEPDLSGKNGLTALHVAAHYNNPNVAVLLLENKASPHCVAKNGYTPLHIAAKKNELRIASTLLKFEARADDKSKSGFTPLHLATQEGHTDMAALLLNSRASANCKANNGLTALHLAAQEDHVPVAEVLVQHQAQIDPRTKAGYTPLHTACHFGQINMIRFLLSHGASVDASTKLGYTPLHQASQQGHVMVINLLLKHDANADAASNNGQTALDIADQLGYISVVEVLKTVTSAEARGESAPDYSHQTPETMQETFMSDSEDEDDLERKPKQREAEPVRGAAGSHPSLQYLTESSGNQLHGSEDNLGESGPHVYDVGDLSYTRDTRLSMGPKAGTRDSVADSEGFSLSPGIDSPFTPSQDSFQYQSTPRNLGMPPGDRRLEASPVMTSSPDVTSRSLDKASAPSVAPVVGSQEMLGSRGTLGSEIAEVEVKVDHAPVTEAAVLSMEETSREPQQRSLPPEVRMRQPLVAATDARQYEREVEAISCFIEDEPLLPMTSATQYAAPPVSLRPPRPAAKRDVRGSYAGSVLPDTTPDNVPVLQSPLSSGFLVSFMVDARGGALRGCRYPGVRVLVPPRAAPGPTRVLCRLVKKEKLLHPPPLGEGEGLAARILETGPVGTQFLSPVVFEVPHFASLRGREREVVVLRCDDGENWYEHPLSAEPETVSQIVQEHFTEVSEEDTGRAVTRLVTTDLPQFFALVTRVRQEKQVVGEQGGRICSSVAPQVQADFPEGALSKKIAIGLQAQPIPPDLVSKLLGNRVAVSPIVTVEPRRRKFRKPVTISMPLPQAAAKGMINTYSGGDSGTLRLLCSITGDTASSQWQDVTTSTALNFNKDCVSFNTNISARFWLLDCQNTAEAAAMAALLYAEVCAVPYTLKFGVFARRLDQRDAQLRCFAFTDDRLEKSLEKQEQYTEVARSRHVEALDGRAQYVEMSGNLIPVTKSGEQLSMHFTAFDENRLTFPVRVRDLNQDPVCRLAFFAEPRELRESAARPTAPVCSLDVTLPSDVVSCASSVADDSERQALEEQLAQARNMAGGGKEEGMLPKAGSGDERSPLVKDLSLDVQYDERDLTKESESAAGSQHSERESSTEPDSNGAGLEEEVMQSEVDSRRPQAMADTAWKTSADKSEAVRELVSRLLEEEEEELGRDSDTPEVQEEAVTAASSERQAAIADLLSAMDSSPQPAASPTTPPATPSGISDISADPPQSADVAERLAEEGFEESSASSEEEVESRTLKQLVDSCLEDKDPSPFPQAQREGAGDEGAEVSRDDSGQLRADMERAIHSFMQPEEQ